MTRPYVIEALKEIKRRNRGKLKPAAVVNAARDPDHPLHKQFDWNDTSAAAKYRLWQARQLIASVTILCERDNKPMPAYVSLGGDRHAGGGYRAIEDVMSDQQLREELLKTAFEELDAMKTRYARFRELDRVWEAAESAKRVKAA